MENVSSTQLSKETDPEEYHLVVLGSGAGSKLTAGTLAKQGKRVAVIERKYIGGSCPNIACLPSKNIVHSAKVASYFGRGKEFGIATKGFAVDMSAVRDRKRRMVSGEVEAHLDNYKRSGAELILGSVRFIGPKTLEATLPDGTRRRLRGANVIIGTGTHAALEPIPGITRNLLQGGLLRRYIDELSVTGLTSNPTIFDHAVKNSTDYDVAYPRETRGGQMGGGALFRTGTGRRDPSCRPFPSNLRSDLRRGWLGFARSLPLTSS
jgi:Pyridine nucleotide-disulphide oxidoreductase